MKPTEYRGENDECNISCCSVFFGLRWERGFQLMGTLSLSMIVMIVLAPFISHILSPILSVVAEHTVLEPPIIAGFFAGH